MMISRIVFMTIVLPPAFAIVKANGIEAIFKKNKVKLEKVETRDGEKFYYVALPFDPSVGKNSNHLEAELTASNGCKTFTMISAIDSVKIRVSATRSKDSCSISESIEPLK